MCRKSRELAAAADLFPALAAFYQQLAQEKLCFSLAQRFKQYPQFMGLQFTDDAAEPSFLGYDHPAVLIFKKERTAEITEALYQSRQKIIDNPYCSDRLMQQAARHLQDGELERAPIELNEVARHYPKMQVSHFIAAHIYQLGDRPQEQAAALEHYRSGIVDKSIHLVPLASSMTLLHLELNDLALAALADGIHYIPHCRTRQLHFMKSSYDFIATLFDKSGQQERATQVRRLTAIIKQNL